MGARPKVHRAELEGAISRIARRRAKVDDVHRDRLPDAPDSDPREVLHYLHRYSGQDIPRWVLQADVCDAITLNNWLWWEDRRMELHFLTEGRRRGLYLDQLGAQLGIGKQGVRDRIDRLQALLRHDRPDEKLTRASRSAARAAERRRTAEDSWLDEQTPELRAAIADLLAEAETHGLAPEEREWLDELTVDVESAGPKAASAARSSFSFRTPAMPPTRVSTTTAGRPLVSTSAPSCARSVAARASRRATSSVERW